MKVCDYIVKRLCEEGVRHVFGVVGGGAAALNDSFGRSEEIRWVGTHHEQCAAYAAIGMSKITGRLSVVNPTTGCGGTNCITGVLDAWQDSVPVLFISGNVNRAQMTYFEKDGVRQHGVQEANIIPLVESITKYSDIVFGSDEIVAKLDEAIYEATSGRMGPVWLDIPTDVQSAEIDFDKATPFVPWVRVDGNIDFPFLEHAIEKAERPLFLLGAGARKAEEENILGGYLRNIPFVGTYGAVDILSMESNNIGRVGVKGSRAGNMALYNCDLLVVLGSSLTTPVTGYNLKEFAPRAGIIIVDIESSGYHLGTTGKDIPAIYVSCGVETFVKKTKSPSCPLWWAKKCEGWKSKWPTFTWRDSVSKEGLSIYLFVREMSRHISAKSAVVCDTGSVSYVVGQSLELKPGQRNCVSLSQSDMGWALPASVGVALAGMDAVVMVGDGAFQFSLQELATVKALKLPIKIFVFNNSGYATIRATQNKLFEGNLVGTDKEHGLWFPEIRKIAAAYDMKYSKIESGVGLGDAIKDILDAGGPSLVEVICPKDQQIVPTIGSRRDEKGNISARPLYDMFPFIDNIEEELV